MKKLKLFLYPVVMGGRERRYLAYEPEQEMIIPEQLRRSVAFICYTDKNGDKRYCGTCFFFALKEEEFGGTFTHTITAKHVIVGVKEKSRDGKAIVRVNLTEGGVEYLETNADDWFSDPDDPTDVAILEWVPEVGGKYAVAHIQDDMVMPDEVEFRKRPGHGDDVAIIGLFVNHAGQKRNLPIVRAGNIAALPEEKVSTKEFGDIDAFLVECRSIGGLSGSPVFAHLTAPRVTEDGVAELNIRTRYVWLLGLIHGHYDAPTPNEDTIVDLTTDNEEFDRERINMGIAIVIPAKKIMDALNHPLMAKKREEEMKEVRKRMLPTEDAQNEQKYTRKDLENALKKAFSPRKDEEQTSGEGKSET